MQQYANVSVKYIHGHNPDLVLYEDGQEKERVDLKAYDSADKLTELLHVKGLTTFSSSACIDATPQCPLWATRGFCASNSRYMHVKCRKSCGTCGKVEL